MEIYDSWGFPIVKDLEGICLVSLQLLLSNWMSRLSDWQLIIVSMFLSSSQHKQHTGQATGLWAPVSSMRLQRRGLQ